MISLIQYRAVCERGAAINLSQQRAKWRLTGSDRVRFLNGQVTQEVRQLSPGKAVQACVTNVKGKIEAELQIHAEPEALILDAPICLRESLALRLEKYIIADDVTLEDVTDAWQLWHFLPTAPEGLALSAESRLLQAQRLEKPGYDLWLPAGHDAPPFTHALLDEAEANAWRVLHHVPAWPEELAANAFPQETGLTDRVMSFSKGCYIGQEVLSRIKTSGKTPRKLIPIQSAEPLIQGQDILSDGQCLGSITSSTQHPETGLWHGLGYVKASVANSL
jgi:tRNA-modifying protein YgfZ